MDKELFAYLVTSLTEAGKIAKGQAKPPRITTLEKSGKTSKGPAKPKNKTATAPVIQHKKIDAREVREKTGLSQSDFAIVMNVSIKTLQNWEQHRREPTGAADSLLRVFAAAPELVLKALHHS
ncbi:helix-turn-helix domain-containing protein [Undibacterium sp. TS12]|uniref:helix-turn-helix domain-containing protein n=1 Tax=Undibacterium sp. TS12 TaxID=2908202 RepID=UPI001F4C6C4E|nr:helix-turn-helix domain-containing protein [Undibacterium sp. TS12]MCH8619601.1 helix-turn-helix domain-containing protein [Undibacterium sp. TS12]